MKSSTSESKRRRWTEAEKLKIVSEARAPGSRVRDVAARYDLNPAMIYIWSKLLDRMPHPASSVVEVENLIGPHRSSDLPPMEIRVGRIRIIIDGPIDEEALRILLTAARSIG